MIQKKTEFLIQFYCIQNKHEVILDIYRKMVYYTQGNQHVLHLLKCLFVIVWLIWWTDHLEFMILANSQYDTILLSIKFMIYIRSLGLFILSSCSFDTHLLICFLFISGCHLSTPFLVNILKHRKFYSNSSFCTHFIYYPVFWVHKH